MVVPVPQVDGGFAATGALVLSGYAEHNLVGPLTQVQPLLITTQGRDYEAVCMTVCAGFFLDQTGFGGGRGRGTQSAPLPCQHFGGPPSWWCREHLAFLKQFTAILHILHGPEKCLQF